jgi:hypothetical protein
MGWMSRVQFLAEAGIPLFTTAFRLVLRPTQSFVQLVPEALSQVVKQSGHQTDNPPPFNAKVMNAWNCTSTPAPMCLHGVVLN